MAARRRPHRTSLRPGSSHVRGRHWHGPPEPKEEPLRARETEENNREEELEALAGLAAVAALAAGVAGPHVYIHFVEGKPGERMTAATSSSPAGTNGSGSGSTSADGSTEGTWSVSSGSTVGYRVKEVLFGRRNEAVGRTSDMTGSIVVQGTSIVSGSFNADLTSVSSDRGRRDRQFHGRIMETCPLPGAVASSWLWLGVGVGSGSAPRRAPRPPSVLVAPPPAGSPPPPFSGAPHHRNFARSPWERLREG